MKIVGITVIILFLTSSCMMMMPMHSNNMMHNSANDGIYKDVVCGTEIDTSNSLSYNYDGEIYFFDSDECLTVFQKNPEQFIKKHQVKNNRFRSVATITGGTLFMLGMMALMIF